MRYKYRAKIKNGAIEKGIVDAESQYQATVKLKEKYEYILNLKKESMLETKLKSFNISTETLSKWFPTLTNSRGKKKRVQTIRLDDTQKQELKEYIKEEFNKDKVTQKMLGYEQVEVKSSPASGDILTQGYELSFQDLGKEKQWKNRFIRIKVKDKIEFTRQLSILLKTGVSLPNALNIILLNTTNVRFKQIIGAIMYDISRGKQFASALAKYPEVFPIIYISMIEVGENTGSTEVVLDDLVNFLKLQSFLKKEVTKFMIYPAVVLGMLLVMLLGASLFLVPRFRTLFDDMEIELPTITKVIFFISENLLFGLGTLAVIIIGAVVASKYVPYVKDVIKKMRDYLELRVPVIKQTALNFNMLQISNSLGLLLKNGIKINSALINAERVVTNNSIKQEIIDLRSQIEKGERVAQALQNKKHFTPVFKSSVGSGEYAGELDTVLLNLSEYYEEELRENFTRLAQMIQPVSVILLAVILLPFIVGIYLPIAQMSNQGF